MAWRESDVVGGGILQACLAILAKRRRPNYNLPAHLTPGGAILSSNQIGQAPHGVRLEPYIPLQGLLTSLSRELKSPGQKLRSLSAFATCSFMSRFGIMSRFCSFHELTEPCWLVRFFGCVGLASETCFEPVPSAGAAVSPSCGASLSAPAAIALATDFAESEMGVATSDTIAAGGTDRQPVSIRSRRAERDR